jgi:methylphosphotriester-DNA--protein-cysteine methyltransferase
MKRVWAAVAAICFLTFTAGAGFAADCNFVASKGGEKYHNAACGIVKNIKDENKLCFNYPEEAIQAGYSACGMCKPATGTKVVASKDSDKYHLPACGLAKNIKAENLVSYDSSFEAAKAGKTACGVCKPPKVEKKAEAAPAKAEVISAKAEATPVKTVKAVTSK